MEGGLSQIQSHINLYGKTINTKLESWGTHRSCKPVCIAIGTLYTNVKMPDQYNSQLI